MPTVMEQTVCLAAAGHRTQLGMSLADSLALCQTMLLYTQVQYQNQVLEGTTCREACRDSD